ncbi:MAG: hypothetical protein AVDCRST_MAG75-297, partial [uncultured Propionibacteriaceae bacterium]
GGSSRGAAARDRSGASRCRSTYRRRGAGRVGADNPPPL